MDIDFVEKVTYNECDSPALLSEPISVGKGLFINHERTRACTRSIR
jgi:hypothetical protein